MRRGFKILLVVLGGILLMTAGLFLWSGGKLIFLEFTDFPHRELEGLVTARAFEAQLTLDGPVEVKARSFWTWWAMKLFPGHFMVDAKVDSRKVTLLVDTGAALTVLSPEVAVAARASLIALGPEITHWQQKIPTYLGYVQELDISGLKAYHVPVLVLGKQPILKLLGLRVYRVGGFLGMSMMEKLAVTLDWHTGEVTFRRESLKLHAPSAPLRVVEQELQGFRIPYYVSDALLDGAGTYPALIDTGASYAEVLISDELLRTLGWKEEKVLIRQLKLGEIELRDVWAVPARQKEATGARLSGQVMLIGSGIFQAQGFKRLTLDFLAGKLYAER